MAKWIRLEKSSWGLSRSIVIFNKISFYAGVTDHWGIGANINFYDRALTFEFLCWYFGVEVWHMENEEEMHPPEHFRDRSNGE